MKLYIDPGTGSMLFSVAIGLVSVLWFGIRKLWMTVKYRTGGKTDTNKKGIVIYSEDKRYWTTFKGILDEFERREIPVTYLAGSEDDPLLENDYEYVEKEVIGLGNKAFARLNFLNCRVLLSTTPGLDVYQWKRSKDVDFYAHVTHSIGGVLGYRMFGTEFYDAILLSAKQFVDPVRELEERRNSKPKEVEVVGLTYMDALMKRKSAEAVDSNHTFTVLLAPSWGENSIFNRFGEKILDILLASGYKIIVRPHPQTYISDKEMINALENKYSGHSDICWDKSSDNYESLSKADIMISDFSGVIFDFAFVFEKPVIYVPAKMNLAVRDQAWVEGSYWTDPILPMIGRELREDELDHLKETIDEMSSGNLYIDSIRKARDECWQNRESAAETIVDYLLKKSQELMAEA